MSENSLIYDKNIKKNTWIYKFLLFLSFVWVSLYPVCSSLVYSFRAGYGNLFDSVNSSAVISSILFEALFAWASFEILFWIYRYVLTFKIYTYVVPMDSLKAETRSFFMYRNVFYGLFYNLCFLFPFLEGFAVMMNVLITLIVLICYSRHLNNTYSDPIIGHFVFKNFCFPVFVYEGLCILYSILVVLWWRRLNIFLLRC